MIIDPEIENLFKQVRTALGAPIRPVQLSNDQLCDLLDFSVKDYNSVVENWVITNNWISMFGQNVNSLDLTFAITMRRLDMQKKYSQWFSKELGLQQNGLYELKKDYITIERGKQDYLIPAGREINKVLYVNPPEITPAIMGGLGSVGFGGMYGSMGMPYGTGAGMNGGGGFYSYNLYDTLLTATDINNKMRTIHSDMTFSVTALESGEHIIHLQSTPGSKFAYGNSRGWLDQYVNCIVWYTFYDVSSNEDAENCRRLNPDTIITPDQVPIAGSSYTFFNEPTKTTIRQLLVANAKITLGLIRGYASGKVSIPNAELNLDYQILLQQGEKEKEVVFTKLEERLEKMTPWAQMKIQADMTDDLLRSRKGQPLPVQYVIA